MPDVCLHDTIHDDDPAVQRFLSAVERPLPDRVNPGAWQVARVLTIHLVEAVLAERASTQHTGPAARSVGQACAVRLCKAPDYQPLGPIQWGEGRTVSPWVETPQVAPLDEALGYSASGAVGSQALGCALAVFVRLRLQPACWAGTVGAGQPQAVWGWVQAAGHKRWSTPEALHALAQGTASAGGAARAGRCSLVSGADGVMVPSPDGWSADREDPMARSQSRGVGPLDSIARARQGHHPAAPASAGGGLGGYRGAQARLWWRPWPGHQHAPRWSGSVMAHGAYGAV